MAEALQTVIWYSPFGHRKDHAVSRFAIHTFESTPEAARQRVQSGDFSCVDTVEA